MMGSSSSVMMTSKLSECVLPFTSVLVYVTVVVPTGNESPESWVDVREPTPQLSSEVGSVQDTVVLQIPWSAEPLIFEGIPEMVGSSSSVIVMKKLVALRLPAASTAV